MVISSDEDFVRASLKSTTPFLEGAEVLTRLKSDLIID